MKKLLTILIFLPLFSLAQADGERAFPNEFEIVKSFFHDKTVDTIRGWKIEFLLCDSYGDFANYDLKITCLNKKNSLLPVYYMGLTIMVNPSFLITMETTKEEMERRNKEIDKK